MRFALCLAATSLLALSACGSADTEAVQETIRLTEKAHHDAIAAKDVYGATRSYTDDAMLTLPNTATVAGKDALGKTYEAYLADPNFAIEVAEGPSWVASSGDLAVTTYEAEVTMSDAAGQAIVVPVANQTVWTKIPGKGWQIASEHNVGLPAASVPAIAANQG